MSTSSISTTPTPTRRFRLLAYTVLLISTNSLTLCLLYTLRISTSKQRFGFRTKPAALQISWLAGSGLLLVVSLCYLISSYYRGHQRRMIAAAARHDAEMGERELGGGREGGGSGRRGETELIAGPPYELQPRPESAFIRALALARRGGGNQPNSTLALEGGGTDVVREKERRHGPVYSLQKPLPPNPTIEEEGEEEDGEQQRRRGELWRMAPAAAPPVVNTSRSLRIPRNPLARLGQAVYPSYNTGASAILPFGQVNVNSVGGAPGVRVGVQGAAVDGDNDSESLGSQPLYANSELRDVIGRYL